ncbi:IS630 family transposase [Microvirga sp. KLBC 81]|uniref:IS630 family transposase n=1 Tax=Microvirga sp. KLBC 81 TaxID=1862707 RepID=UPI001FE07748|nr:IS630 family transposase [Microvirga sp. KLBC 81]
MSGMPAERLVFLDESGITTKMARTHARALRGQRAYGSVPLGSWQRLTVLGALACEGLVATMSIEASTSTSVLLAYLEQVLVPKLQQVKPDAILVMDNLRPHRATEVGQLLEQAGIGLTYLPRYSPDLNPIEQAWAKMKERLKAQAGRSLEALEAELKPARDTITAKDARGWFRHAGYAYTDPKFALAKASDVKKWNPLLGLIRCFSLSSELRA